MFWLLFSVPVQVCLCCAAPMQCDQHRVYIPYIMLSTAIHTWCTYLINNAQNAIFSFCRLPIANNTLARTNTHTKHTTHAPKPFRVMLQSMLNISQAAILQLEIHRRPAPRRTRATSECMYTYIARSHSHAFAYYIYL